jgi:glyceraldehyde 3-phosphate dehydrogenase
MNLKKDEQYFSDWKQREEIAEAMLPIIGRLYRDHGVVITVYGLSLVHCSMVDVLKAHRSARQILENELSVRESFPVLQAIDKLDLAPSRIDIGKLTVRYLAQGPDYDVNDFIRSELSEVNTGKKPLLSEPRDVVLYGFGRIGRLLARILVDKAGGGDKLRLRAAVVRKGGEDDLIKRASLMRRDSVHGHFSGAITVDEKENAIIANGNMIRLIYADEPDKIDYTKYGIDNAILIDNTGKWRDREGLGRHLKSKGIGKVILTAPGKGDVPNIVYGVNNELLTDNENSNICISHNIDCFL